MVLNNKISIVLIIIAFFSGTVVVSNIVPNASAVPITHNTLFVILQDVQTKVTTLLTNVGNIQTSSNAIKTKTDNLPTDPASNTAISNAQNAINSHTDTAISSIPSGGLTAVQFETLKCNSPIRAHVDLSGCILNNVNLNLADLSYANLAGADLENAQVGVVDFNHANLNGVNFNNAVLTNADLNRATLIGANLNYAHLTGTNFYDTDLTGITFVGCIGTPTGVPALGTLPTCAP